jgi:hypothetical protein
VTRSTAVSFDRHWCSQVAPTVVIEGSEIRIPPAAVVMRSEPGRGAVSCSKLSMPYA